MDYRDPFSLRDIASFVLPKCVVDFFGPYPDEVGWFAYVVLFAVKAFCAAVVFWTIVDLVLPKALGDELAKSMVLSGIAAMLVAWLYPSNE